MSSPNASSDQQPAVAVTYVDLVHQNGGHHSAVMWLIMGEKCLFSSIGILFNATLVATTVRSKNLKSICNVLIALDSAFLAVYQLNALITFFMPIFGTNFVPISLCFYLQGVPYFAILMSFCVMFQIGLERLANVLFPIWSMNDRSKHFHVIFLLFNTLPNCFVMWLQYDDTTHGVNTMVLCTTASVPALGGFSHTFSHNQSMIMHITLVIVYSAIFLILKFKKGNQNFSKSMSIFRSLLFLVVLEMVGWVPIIHSVEIIKLLNLSPINATYAMSAGTTLSSCITASANAPTLYYFSESYRDEINAFLATIGIKAKQPRTHTKNSLFIIRTNNNQQMNSRIIRPQ